jgi:hypothetical protein
MDEVALALVTDAWSRTFRSRAVTFTRAPGAVKTRDGIRLLAAQVAGTWPADELIPAIGNRKPAEALDETLREIGVHYGTRTTDFVTMQLEYPRDAAPESVPAFHEQLR